MMRRIAAGLLCVALTAGCASAGGDAAQHAGHHTSRGFAGTLDVGRELGPDAVILVNLSGRGDKDVDTAADWFGVVSEEEIVTSAKAAVEDPQAGAGEGW